MAGAVNKGFTLIELIIAIAITALIGLAAHFMLATVIDNRAHLTESQESILKLDAGLRVIQRDLQQLAPMQIKGEDFSSGNYGIHIRPLSESVETTFLEFVRFNEKPGVRQRSIQLINVRYKLVGHKLIREEREYPVLPDTGGWFGRVIFSDISEIELQVFDYQWQTLNSEYRNIKLPKAVRLVFESLHWGKADLVVPLLGEPS